MTRKVLHHMIMSCALSGFVIHWSNFWLSFEVCGSFCAQRAFAVACVAFLWWRAFAVACAAFLW
ncbi:hypothetical protein C8R45DRAFT_1010408, partial [Mycena sanguinolenta]